MNNPSLSKILSNYKLHPEHFLSLSFFFSDMHLGISYKNFITKQVSKY